MGWGSRLVPGTLCLGSLLALGSACSGNQPRDTVPPDVQQRSKEMFGEQQQTMFEMFVETPSQQAGQRFERDTKPVRPPDRTPPPEQSEPPGEQREVR